MTQEHKRKRRKRRRSSAPIVTRIEDKTRIPHKHVMVVFIVFVVAIGLYNSTNFTLANLDYYEAKSIVNKWEIGDVTNKREEYQAAESAIQSALAYHFDKPLYLETYAQIIEWGFVFQIVDKNKLKQAKRFYQSALEIRPLWPVTYANLAMTKWRMEELDDDFKHYLYSAHELGSQTQEVHLLFTKLGIIWYQANHPLYTEFKDIIFERIRLGIRNPSTRPKVLAYIASSNSKKDICRWFKEFDRYTAVSYLDCSY